MSDIKKLKSKTIISGLESWHQMSSKSFYKTVCDYSNVYCIPFGNLSSKADCVKKTFLLNVKNWAKSEIKVSVHNLY